MEVVPGIHKVDGTWGGNVYLLLDDDGLVLVDAALPFNGGRILRYIQRLGRDPSELRSIILTHAHPDHTGAIPMLKQRADLSVFVHANDTRKDSEGRPRLHYPGQLLTLPVNLPIVRPIYAQELLEEGHTFPDMGGMRVLHTPGHTSGSVSLYLEERRVLITGDMLISDGRRFYRPLPFPGTDFKAYRQSVERLAGLDFAVACVGHGRPVVGGARDKLHGMLENYRLALFPWRHLRKLVPLR